MSDTDVGHECHSCDVFASLRITVHVTQRAVGCLEDGMQAQHGQHSVIGMLNQHELPNAGWCNVFA